MTVADFFAVSVRNSAYLNIGPFIAQFHDYTIPLIDHLLNRKVDHWDYVIRELTAKALHNLATRVSMRKSQKRSKAVSSIRVKEQNMNTKHKFINK